MKRFIRCALGVFVALSTILAASCSPEGGVGVGAPLGPRQKWGGGGTSGPGVIVMGGGPVYQ